MDSLPYEFNCMDISRLEESSNLKGYNLPNNDIALRHAEAFDSGFQSLNFLAFRGKSPKTRGDQSPEKSLDLGDQSEMQIKVDFFRKLGYSPGEIYAVLQNLGIDADNNAVLGELVKHGGNPDRESGPVETTDPTLVPRGGLGTRTATSSTEESDSNNLRPVVIDGSNVAMSHGNKEVFSCRGILVAVNFFLERGHTDITVFVPSWRKEQPRPEMPITDQHILGDLEKKKVLVFTPSRRVAGRRLVCYDDRFIVKLAYRCDGIIVSNDTYRDLQSEKPEWKKFIEERLLMYSFVNDIFMPPDDPMGRKGPNLDDFLRKRPLGPENKKIQCPYGKRCTYGMKCKFYHPERINQTQRSVADELRKNAKSSPSKSNNYIEDKNMKKQSAAEASIVNADNSCLQKIPLERTGSSQRSSEMDKNALKQYYSNGAPEWFTSSVSSKDSIPYDSGVDFWTSVSNSYCDPSHDPIAYSSCNQHIPCRQHSHDVDADPRKHYGSQKMVVHGPHSAPYFPYDQSLPWSAPNLSGYRKEMSEPCRAAHHSLPPPGNYNRDYWSEPNTIHHSAVGSQTNFPVYRQVQPSNHQWPNPEHYSAERQSVRTKLCAIFQPHLVDAVMNMYPQQMDPQILAGEIFNYRAQHRM